MRFSSLAWAEGFKMAEHLRDKEQYLFDTAADFLARMVELEKLREAVRLAEVTEALRRPVIRKASICVPVLNCASN
jgi:hypothetical protein